MKKFILFARACTLSMCLFPIALAAQDSLSIYPNYVVIGAFEFEKNAIHFTDEANTNKFPAKFEMNPNRNLYYVYVLTTQDRAFAFAEAVKLRKDTKYFDTWVYSGPLGDFKLINVAGAGQDLNPETGGRVNTSGADQHAGNRLSSEQQNLEAATLRSADNVVANAQAPGDALITGNEDEKGARQVARRGNGKRATTKQPGATHETTTGLGEGSRQPVTGLTGFTADGTAGTINTGSENESGLNAGTLSGTDAPTQNKGQASNKTSGKRSGKAARQAAAKQEKEMGGVNLGEQSAGQANGDNGQPETEDKSSSDIPGQTTANLTGDLSDGVTNQADAGRLVAGQQGIKNGGISSELGKSKQTTDKSGVNNAQASGEQALANANPTGKTSGQTSKNAAGQTNGQKAGEKNAQSGTQTSGQTTGDKSGTNNQQASGEQALANANTTGKTSGQTSKNAAGQTNAQKAGEKNAQSGTQTSAQTTGDKSRANAAGQTTAQRAGDNRAETSAEISGQVITQAEGPAAGQSDSKNALSETKTDGAKGPGTIAANSEDKKLGPPPQRVSTEPLTKEEVVGKDFYFHIFRADNHNMIPGEVEAIDFEKSRRMATYEGNTSVKVIMPSGKTKQISFVCEVFGYRKLQREYDPAAPADDLYLDDKGNVVLPFELIRLQKGDIAIMYNVFFFKDAAVMRPESRFEVNNLLEFLVENPSYKIMIHGHTNGNASGKIIRMDKPGNFYSLSGTKQGVGSAKQLSEERAIVIREFLISSGIPAERMDVKAWGGKKPIHDKHSVRANENVRVEIEILRD